MQKISAEQKYSNLGPKNALYDYFWAVIYKKNHQIWNIFLDKIKKSWIWDEECHIWELLAQ